MTEPQAAAPLTDPVVTAPTDPATIAPLTDLVVTAPTDPATIAALAEVLAARAALDDEIVRLQATARAAVDIRAKVKRNPGRTAAVVGGTAFVAVGGPRRVLRGVRHRVFGRPDPLPPSLLPDQVDKAVRALGDDGTKVRGALEREFAAFVDTNRKGDSKFMRRLLLTGGIPLASQIGREIVKRVFEAPEDDVASREEQIRSRRDTPGPGASTR
jgi:hypothetical protein